MRRLLHSDYFTEMKIGSNILPNDTPKDIVYVDNPKQFSLLYKYKLLRYSTKYPIANEIDFINRNLEISSNMHFECKRYRDNLLDSGDRVFTEDDLNYEIILFEKWIYYLKACYDNVSKRIEPKDFLFSLTEGQGTLSRTDYNNIAIHIQEAIDIRFKYFEDKYNAKWGKPLKFIFTTIANYYKRIGDTPQSPEPIKKLKVDLKLHSNSIIEKLDEFERFFQYILEKNNIDDCVRLLLFLKGIILDFKVILSGHGYNFQKSYFYNIVNDFYSRMESEYNTERLKLITVNNRVVENVANESKKIKNEVHSLTFESMFHKKEYASIALKVLRDIDPSIIDSNNQYIGKTKGVFKVWINEMSKHKPCLIIPMTDMQYRNILNDYIKGLNLSKDASELRKLYKGIDNIFRLNLASLLQDTFKSSQSSQSSQNPQ